MDETPNYELSHRECWDQLRATDVGRLAMTVDGQPEIFPVNFVVDHASIVFRTAPGTKHTSVRAGRRIAFEVDGVDKEAGLAWSVVLKGKARDITNLYDVLNAAKLPLSPLNDAPKALFVRLEPDEVTGRRFPLAAKDRWVNELSYAKTAALE